MVDGLRVLSYEERLVACNLQSLEERRNRGDLIQTFKFMKGIDKVPHKTFFTPAKQTFYHRGHSAKPFKGRSCLEVRNNFFSQRVVNSWNSLPQSVVEAETTNMFKNRLVKETRLK